MEDADRQAEAHYARTRKSLIERLADWEDQRSWDEFYQTYWRLIYSVSTKAGLSREEAFDVVQETVVAVAKQWRKGQAYDPERGSFKTWLMNLTRWRISDQFRLRQRNPAAASGARPDSDEEGRRTATIDRIEGEDGAEILDQLWEREWKSNLAAAALARVKKLVSPKQFQIFHAYVIKEWDVAKVRDELGVSQSQVYLAKHRVGALVKEEIEKLKREFA